MPSFAITDAQALANFLYPVTEKMAEEVISLAGSRVSGEADMAVYYHAHTSTPDKPRKLSVRVIVRMLEGNNNYLAHVWTDDYRPRKDGAADLVFQSKWQEKF